MLLDQDGNPLTLEGKLFLTSINKGRLPQAAEKILSENHALRIIFLLTKQVVLSGHHGPKKSWQTEKVNIRDGDRDKAIEDIVNKCNSGEYGGFFVASSSL